MTANRHLGYALVAAGLALVAAGYRDFHRKALADIAASANQGRIADELARLAEAVEDKILAEALRAPSAKKPEPKPYVTGCMAEWREYVRDHQKRPELCK